MMTVNQEMLDTMMHWENSRSGGKADQFIVLHAATLEEETK